MAAPPPSRPRPPPSWPGHRYHRWQCRSTTRSARPVTSWGQFRLPFCRRPLPFRSRRTVDRLAGRGGIAAVFDERSVRRIWQDAVHAVAGQLGHLILQWQPSVRSVLCGGHHDQGLVAQTLERLRLLKGGLQFGKLLVLAAGQLRAGLGRTLLVASLWRQTAKARQVDESKHADTSE